MEASVVLRDGMIFDATTESGHRLVTAAAPVDGEPSAGPLPMELVLVAAASCTAMDVTAILRKMRQPLAGLRVEVSGERAGDHPKAFTHIDLRYIVQGRGLDPAQVERAIQLSQERYCSVAATLRPTVRLTHTWQIDEEAGLPEEAAALRPTA